MEPRRLCAVLALCAALAILAVPAEAQWPKAGTSQFWAGKAGYNQRVDNPTGDEYYAMFVFYNLNGRLRLDAGDGGCEGEVVPAHGSAECQGGSGNCVPSGSGPYGVFPYEMFAVPTSNGAFDRSGNQGRGVLANSSKMTAVPLPPRMLKPPTVMADRVALISCICDELSEDGQDADLYANSLGLDCTD